MYPRPSASWLHCEGVWEVGGVRTSDAGDETQVRRGDEAVEAAGACDCFPGLAGGEVTGDADEGCDGQGGREMEARGDVESVCNLGERGQEGERAEEDCE